MQTTRWFSATFLKKRNGDFQLPPTKSHKKGQIKIQQMLFMLLAVTLFFVLVGIFLLVFVFSGLNESVTSLQEKNALLLVTRLANSPEFSCEESFGSNKVNCVDGDKIMMLMQNSKKYEGFWGTSNIVVRKIYPEVEGEVVCSLNNYPNCNILDIHSKENAGAEVSNFVTLCRKDSSEGEGYDKCELARMSVSYEVK